MQLAATCLLLTVLLSTLVATRADMLLCYFCLDSNACRKFIKHSKEITKLQCPPGVPCVKVTILDPSQGGEERVTRGCYTEKLCTELSTCYKCNKNLCNHSSTHLPCLLALAASFVCAAWYL